MNDDAARALSDYAQELLRAAALCPRLAELVDRIRGPVTAPVLAPPALRLVWDDRRKYAAENANTAVEYERLLAGLPVDGVA